MVPQIQGVIFVKLQGLIGWDGHFLLLLKSGTFGVFWRLSPKFSNGTGACARAVLYGARINCDSYDSIIDGI